jgi:hypothetical protein
MRELALNSGLRVLLGVIGGVAVCAGIAVVVDQLRRATRDGSASPTGIVVALLCVLIVVGGVRVLQGAGRGGIAVRDPAGRDASRKRG